MQDKKTGYRISYPTKTKRMVHEMPMDFDLHVNIGDWVEFAWLPDVVLVITHKKFKVLGDNSIEYVDYVTETVENPELP